MNVINIYDMYGVRASLQNIHKNSRQNYCASALNVIQFIQALDLI